MAPASPDCASDSMVAAPRIVAAAPENLSKQNPYVAILGYGYALAWFPVLNHALKGEPLTSPVTPWDSVMFAVIGAFTGAITNCVVTARQRRLSILARADRDSAEK